MPRRKSISREMVASVAKTTFDVLPLLRRRLLRMDMVQSEHNVPMSHIQVLAMLGEAGMMTVSEISQRLGIAKPNITPLVDRLIAEGFVERRRDQSDRRVVWIVLLPGGEQQLRSIQSTIVDHTMQWVGTIPDKDFYELERSLQSIVRILNQVE